MLSLHQDCEMPKRNVKRRNSSNPSYLYASLLCIRRRALKAKLKWQLMLLDKWAAGSSMQHTPVESNASSSDSNFFLHILQAYRTRKKCYIQMEHPFQS